MNNPTYSLKNIGLRKQSLKNNRASPWVLEFPYDLRNKAKRKELAKNRQKNSSSLSITPMRH